MIYLALGLGLSLICSILVVFACMLSSQLSQSEHLAEQPLGTRYQQEDEKRAPAPAQVLQ